MTRDPCSVLSVTRTGICLSYRQTPHVSPYFSQRSSESFENGSGKKPKAERAGSAVCVTHFWLATVDPGQMLLLSESPTAQQEYVIVPLGWGPTEKTHEASRIRKTRVERQIPSFPQEPWTKGVRGRGSSESPALTSCEVLGQCQSLHLYGPGFRCTMSPALCRCVMCTPSVAP